MVYEGSHAVAEHCLGEAQEVKNCYAEKSNIYCECLRFIIYFVGYSIILEPVQIYQVQTEKKTSSCRKKRKELFGFCSWRN